MAIVNIASFHQYKDTVTIPANHASAPFPNFQKVVPIWSGTLTYFTASVASPATVVDPEQRPWYRLQPASNHSTTSTYGSLSVYPAGIDDDLKVAGTTIIFGFKIATGSASAGGSFIGARAPSATAITATTSVPVISGFNIGPNQYRWIDFVIKYKENNVLELFIYVDKEQAYTATTTYTTNWALSAGTFARSIINATNYNQSIYFNDFITIVDRDEDEQKSGDVGPVTILELELKNPQHNAMWTPSPGMTMRESLGNKLSENVATFDDSKLIRSDPYGSEMIVGFKAPIVEDRKMLAFQQFFVGQKPMSMGANLHYRQTLNGQPLGEKILYDTGTSTNAFHVYMPPVQLPEDNEAAKAIIESHGMAFSSSKKVIPL